MRAAEAARKAAVSSDKETKDNIESTELKNDDVETVKSEEIMKDGEAAKEGIVYISKNYLLLSK